MKLQRSTSHPKRWYRYTILSLKWVGHNPSRLSKHTTQQLWGSQKKPSSKIYQISGYKIMVAQRQGITRSVQILLGTRIWEWRRLQHKASSPHLSQSKESKPILGVNWLFSIFSQLKQTKNSCKGVFLQVELHPRGTKRTSDERM